MIIHRYPVNSHGHSSTVFGLANHESWMDHVGNESLKTWTVLPVNLKLKEVETTRFVCRSAGESGDSHLGVKGGGANAKSGDYMCVLKDDRVAVSCMEESAVFVYDKSLENKDTIKIEQSTSLKV